MAGITLDTLDSSLHSVEVKNAAGDALLIDASGHITITNTSFAATQSGVWDIGTLGTITNVVSVDDNAGSLTVDSTDLATLAGAVSGNEFQCDIIAPLPAGTNTIGDVTVSGNVQTVPGGFAAWEVTKESATTTEAELVSVPLAGRINLLVQNLGSVDVFLGPVTGVSVNDMKLPKGSSFEMALDDGADIFAITAAGTADLRVVEFKA